MALLKSNLTDVSQPVYLLPTNGECFETADGVPLPVDFMSPHSWSEFNLSPISAATTAATATIDGKRKDQVRAAARKDATLTPMSRKRRASTSAWSKTTTRTDHHPDAMMYDSDDVSAQQLPTSEPEAMDEEQPEAGGGAAATDATDSEVLDYLQRTLNRVQAFKREIVDAYDPAKAATYPPLGIITSRATATVRACVVDSYEDVRAGKYDRLAYSAGDGIVLHSSSTSTAVPGRWAEHVKVVEETAHGHVSMLGDLKCVSRALHQL